MKMQNQALSNHPAASVSSWPPKLLFLSLLNGASLMQLKAALLMSFAVKLREEGLGELAMTGEPSACSSLGGNLPCHKHLAARGMWGIACPCSGLAK